MSEGTPGATVRSARWDLVFLGFMLAIATAAIFAEALKASGDWTLGLAWEREFLQGIPRELPWAIDLLFLTLPWLSSNTVVFPIVILVCLWLWRVRHRPDIALHLFIVDFGTFVLTPLLKLLYDRARPDLWTHRGQYAWASYPSGHAMIAVAVYVTIAWLAYRERGAVWPAVILGALMLVSLFSRLYLGVHWPTDVIAGMAIGAVWLALTLPAFRQARVDPSGRVT